jgi:hypothetical protein
MEGRVVAGAVTTSTLPSAIGDWSIAAVEAGLWVSESAGPVPAEVRRLPAEAGRLSVIVDALAPSPGTDSLLADLFPLLSSAGITMVRLVLSSSAGRYAPEAARAHGLDIIAAEAEVTITPHGYALVRPAGPAARLVVPQWRRYLPSSGDSRPAGILYPSPAWERGLSEDLTSGPEHLLATRRVPAGVAVHLPGQEPDLAATARAVWPDPEHLIIVVEEASDDRALLDGLTALVSELPRAAVAGVRLWWPRIAADTGAAALREAAERCGTDLIAPMADVSVSDDCGGVCHGPMGAAPWVRFSSAGAVQLMGSLYPEPDWERSLAEVSLAAPAGLVIEQVAAGLGLYREDDSASDLAAIARRLIPDPARVTIVVGGDATSVAARQDLEAVIGQLPPDARRSLRIAATAFGDGGPRSYAQSLADRFDSLVVAPAGEWMAAPDGKLLARSASDGERGALADGWREFSPRPAVSTNGQAGVAGHPHRLAGQPQRTGQASLNQGSRPPAGPDGDVPAAVNAVLAAEGRRLVRMAPDGDCFYTAAAAALRRVFGWAVPDPQVLRDWLAAGLRSNEGYRAAVATRVAPLLAGRSTADDGADSLSEGALIIGDLLRDRAEQEADDDIRSRMEWLIAQQFRPVTRQDWEQIAVHIETRAPGPNAGSEVAPDLLAVMAGVEIVCILGDGTSDAISPPARAALADPLTGAPVRIFLVRTDGNHWDATEPVSAPAWSPGGQGGQAGDQDSEEQWGYALARAMAGNPLVVAAMRMAVTRLLTYLVGQFGTSDAAQAFFRIGRPADSTAYAALGELLAADTAPPRRSALVTALTGDRYPDGGVGFSSAGMLRALVTAFTSACWGDSPYAFSRLWGDWPMAQLVRSLGMDASWVRLVRFALLADELCHSDGVPAAPQQVLLWREWLEQASVGELSGPDPGPVPEPRR